VLLVLEDFLFPQEAIQYQSDRPIHYADTEYVIFITNRRVLGHKRHGLIRRKDRVLSVALEEITNLQYEEKGLISKSGILLILTKTQQYVFSGKPDDVKIIWKEMQKHLGYRVPLGAPSAYSKPTSHTPTVSESQESGSTSTDEATKILRIRYAKGEITREQYEELKGTLEAS
jgi:hypothetical protein